MKLSKALKIIGIVFLCAILFEILFGSHPIISFVDHRFDIMNNPLGDMKEDLLEKGYTPLTVTKVTEDSYFLSNGMIVDKQSFPKIELDSPLKDTILFNEKDSSLYYHRETVRPCYITCAKLTIPIWKKHHPICMKASGKILVGENTLKKSHLIQKEFNYDKEYIHMETIVCIPLTVATKNELRENLFKNTSGKILYVGDFFSYEDEGIIVESEFCLPDVKMMDAFKAGSGNRISEDDLETINKHKAVLYILWKTPGLESLNKLHSLISNILTAGGLGIKFENSGVSHSKNSWLTKNFYDDTYDLLNSHVMNIIDTNTVFSSGMHIFGLPDVSLHSDIDPQIALKTVIAFNHYHVFEQPVFEEGNTFSLDPKSPYFKINICDDYIYKNEECFENPFGRLKLTAVN